MAKRVSLKAILRDPAKRRELMVRTIIATQAREGITTTREQAEAAYDKIQFESHDFGERAMQMSLEEKHGGQDHIQDRNQRR